MHTVPIPDPLYAEAQRAAEANGVSIELFVREAVQLHLTDDMEANRGPTLSPEQLAFIRQGQADINAGKGLSMAEVEERHALRKAAWLEANPL